MEKVKFKYVSQEPNKILFEDNEGNPVIVTIDEKEYTVFALASKYHVKYKDKVIKFENTDLLKGNITLSNGSEYTQEFSTQEFSRIVPHNSKKTKSNLPFDVQLINNIEDVYDFVEYNIFKVSSILSIPFTFLGLGLIMYPKEFWRFKHFLSVSGGEPTDLAIVGNTLVGIIILGWIFLMPFLMINS